MAITADVIINNVRDQIPDPLYDASGVPLPAADGSLFRATTLYRFCNDAVKVVARKVGWVVNDWWAFPLIPYARSYAIDSKWVSIDDAFANGWRMTYLDQAQVVWPNQVATAQPFWYSTASVTDHWEIGYFPIPTTSEPTGIMLNGGIGATDTTLIVSNAASMLVKGYLQIDTEIIQYGNVSGNTLQGLKRGACGTTAASHLTAAAVSHYSLWAKGNRVPTEVTGSTSVIELPSAFVQPLQLYVLAKCRTAEQEFQEATRLMSEFNQECEQIHRDPSWRTHMGVQAPAYGSPALGGLVFGRVIRS